VAISELREEGLSTCGTCTYLDYREERSSWLTGTVVWTVECELPLVDRYPHSHARTVLLKIVIHVQRETGYVKLGAADIDGLSQL
jgi:hypothetical protein